MDDRLGVGGDSDSSHQVSQGLQVLARVAAELVGAPGANAVGEALGGGRLGGVGVAEARAAG